jgi:hypothetical protein
MENTNLNIGLVGKYSFNEGDKRLSIWLEEDGFFKLHYHEQDGEGYASNEERGQYKIPFSNFPIKFSLNSIERSWKWKDSSSLESDSGNDATDLTYPCVLVNENELHITYLEILYKCKKNQV